MKECDVLIVGLGPSGMMLANELQKYKINYLLIDKRKAISDITRAVNITPASLAIFEYSLRLTNLKNMINTDSINAFWGGELVSRITYSNKKFPYRKFNYIPQPNIENLLVQSIPPSRIFENTELVEIEKRVDGYTVKLNSLNNSVNLIKCKYLIGCDGNNSFIRNWLNISSDEEDYNSNFILYDIETQDCITQDSNYYLSENGYVIIVPIAEKRYRIILSSNEIANTNHNNYNNIDFLARYLHKSCNLTIKITEIKWFTHSAFRHRISRMCNKENAYLVGDALHTFSPVGGLNLNTGLQDAINLGWKLAFVINKFANTTLLSSYSTERMLAINKIKEITYHLTQVMIKAKDYSLSKNYIGLLKNRNHLENLSNMFSGYDAIFEKDNNSLMFAAGHHVSEYVSDSSVYSLLCELMDNRKFNIVTSETLKFELDNKIISMKKIPELNLKDSYLLIRPDGYIHIKDKISNLNNIYNYLQHYFVESIYADAIC